MVSPAGRTMPLPDSNERIIQARASNPDSTVYPSGAAPASKASFESPECGEYEHNRALYVANIADLRQLLSYRRFGQGRTVRQTPLH
jgi:hypothetical protein